MIWVILAALGLPLWFIALALLVMIMRNRSLRKRIGDIPVRVLPAGKKRWVRGHGVWISDVFVWRGSPAAWKEAAEQVVALYARVPEGAEQKKLDRLRGAMVAQFTLADGAMMLVAAEGEHRVHLEGPFGSPVPETSVAAPPSVPAAPA